MKKTTRFLLLTFGLIGILIPLYLTIVSSFKETAQITGDFFGLPNPFILDNYRTVINDGIVQYFLNSTFITVISAILILLIVPMCAYSLVRHMRNKKVFKYMYILLLIGIFVPFQVIMLPITKMMSNFKYNRFNNSLFNFFNPAIIIFICWIYKFSGSYRAR